MKRLMLLLLLPGILWGAIGAVGAAVPSELADSEPSSGNVDSEFSTDSRASTSVALSAPLPTLQAHLNSICEQKLEERCKTVQDDMCQTKPVARKGVGALPEQADTAWRCYGNLSLKENKRDVFCVDSCGVLFKCVGTVPSESLHMTLPELETAVSDNVDKFCSPFQRLLNDYCNNLKEGWVARKGVLTDKEEKKKWRCYDVGILEYEHSSQCLDNCGNVFACRGSRPPVKKQASDVSQLKEGSDFSTIDDADQQLSSVQRPCMQDQVCTRTLQNPPKCVLPHEAEAAREEAAVKEEDAAAAEEEEDEEEEKGEEVSMAEGEILESGPAGTRTSKSHGLYSTGPPQDLHLSTPALDPEEETVTRAHASPPSSLSALLSLYCIKEFDYLCKQQKLDEFCLSDWDIVVARRDLEKPNSAESPAWRCVEKEKLDKSRSSVCVDTCGQKYICRGGIDTKNTIHALWPQLEILVREKADELCAKATGGGTGETTTFTG